MKKRFLFILPLVLLVVSVLLWGKSTSASAAPYVYFNTYKTHPGFWSDWSGGDYQYLGKKYQFGDNPNKIRWVMSAPQSTNYGGDRRIEYITLIDTPKTEEYEIWSGALYGPGGDAVAAVYKAGGKTAQEAIFHFPSTGTCPYGSPGVVDPVNYYADPDAGSVSWVTDILNKPPCSEDGYIATRVIEWWGTPDSTYRNYKCTQYFSSAPQTTQTICRKAPHVGKVHQMQTWDWGTQVQAGCEALIYAWGYTPPTPGDQWQEAKWMSNGELLLTGYHAKTWTGSSLPDPENDKNWWANACEHIGGQSVWDLEEHHKYYIGEYRLQDRIFRWNGTNRMWSWPCPYTDDWMEGCSG
jgi:hypothetical protein